MIKFKQQWKTDHYFAYFCRENIGKIWNINFSESSWVVYSELEYMGNLRVYSTNPYFLMQRDGNRVWYRMQY